MFQLMIVDDEPSVREGIALTVPWGQLDVEVVYQAASGYEALELMKQHSIDIVITDIRMPGMSGLELIHAILNTWTGTRCIILSGHAEFQYAQEAIRSQTMDYLVKPIRTEELIETVRGVQQKLRQEWEQVSSVQQTMSKLYQHRPFMRSKLLSDILNGHYISRAFLEEQMAFLEIPFAEGDEIAMMIIRLEEEFVNYDENSLHLLEYAVCNITEEIFGKHFKLWYYKDAHDFLVFSIKFDAADKSDLLMEDRLADKGKQQLIERLAAQLQKNVQTYLRGRISLMISQWGCFPRDVRELYETSISTMRTRIGSDQGYFFTMMDEPKKLKVNSLDELYRTPTLLHLLEAGKWIDAENKLLRISGEINERFSDSREHLMEAFYVIYATFSNMAHQNGQQLAQLIPNEYRMVGKAEDLRSGNQLTLWSLRVLSRLKEDMAIHTKSARTTILDQVREYVERHLAEDVSLIAIADHVHLHPVYLSKVFKSETGETLTDYLHQLKMSKAAHLLKQSDLKIYEIAAQVGYESTYFMKVFKRHFSVTPQEYRES
ncbi:response regulator transcription factor [Cohnella silvisoli]|uniref:Response regulator n=1 Tax=Cohnella silvisoli TaxID=2873699 RepID=A0ABV1KME2_9BACL|nr:response regulator [Cohnella silvisoli]MCD9020857.1 response regulator [Cohnella silvisoli]